MEILAPSLEASRIDARRLGGLHGMSGLLAGLLAWIADWLDWMMLVTHTLDALRRSADNGFV